MGSDERKLRSVIKETLLKQQRSALVMKAVLQDKIIKVSFEAGNLDNTYDAVLALIQKKAVVKVERGENSGRILSHVNIVKNLTKVSFNKKQKPEITLEFPAGADPNDYELVGFVQNHNTGEIISAAKKGLISLRDRPFG